MTATAPDWTCLLPGGWTLELHASLPSTQLAARAAAEAGAADGTVILALEQSAGIGRRGRIWKAAAGNLSASILLRPGLAPAALPGLSLLTAVCLAEAIDPFLADPAALRLKWPNDLMLAGAKLAGILLETADDGAAVVIGIGVNIAGAPTGLPYPAASLSGVLADPPLPETLIAAIAARFAHWLPRFKAEGFAPVRAAWLGRAAGLGGPVTLWLSADRSETGLFTDIADDGALILTRNGQSTPYHAGEILGASPGPAETPNAH